MSTGVRLDADAIRDEVRDPDGPYDEDARRAIDSFTDDEINAAVDQQTDDAFWEAFDSVRSAAIKFLLEIEPQPKVTVSAPKHEPEWSDD